MKINKYILSMVMVSAAMVGLTSCNDDDPLVTLDPVTGVEGGASESTLKVPEELFKVKIGNDMALPVEGATGKVSAYSLNEEIAKIVDSENGPMIQGLKNGTADIMVGDDSNSYKKFTVSVYTTDQMELSHSSYEFLTPLGLSSTTKECSVKLGNGGYTIESDNSKVEVSIDSETGVITMTATSGKEEYTAIVTVTDCSSLTATLKVNVKPTFEAFTQNDIDMILAKDNSDWYIKSSQFSQTLNKDLPRYEEYGEWKDIAEEGQYIFGWWEDDHDSYATRDYGGHVIFYPAGTNLNQEVDATYQFKYNRGSSYPIYKLEGKAKVLRDDDEMKIVIWWNVDMEHECIDRGWIIRKK